MLSDIEALLLGRAHTGAGCGSGRHLGGRSREVPRACEQRGTRSGGVGVDCPGAAVLCAEGRCPGVLPNTQLLPLSSLTLRGLRSSALGHLQ